MLYPTLEIDETNRKKMQILNCHLRLNSINLDYAQRSRRRRMYGLTA
jgi:hypothetical protein